ncbi:hypothetical protein Q8F55_007461 [Vanrija albida]|uniref:AMMECR1 domain-containing protein n=1 Tax=Vanrija albida TaxID=181172 RepID=A0ABR3PTS3_9TREE
MPTIPPALSSSGTTTPGVTVPATPAEAVCGAEHALYAFDVLAAHFDGRDPVPPPFANAKERFALFVTWNTVRGGTRKPTLRGCIGNFTPMRLDRGLAEYALVAALEDHRFAPIRAAELPSLSVGVSLLTPFTPVATPLSWTPGVHGIHITFPHPSTGRTLNATYLPDVIPEQGWTREEAVKSLVAKAGYRGTVAVGDALWQSIKMKVYEGVKAKATYEEYTAWASKSLEGPALAAAAVAKDHTATTPWS